VQKRIISLLHFALVEGGYLFLGPAETIGPAEVRSPRRTRVRSPCPRGSTARRAPRRAWSFPGDRRPRGRGELRASQARRALGNRMAQATLFVVDDNAGVRRSLRALGESAGLAVQTYASSEEFLRAYDPQQLGCLILDVRLAAGKNGLELQDELQRRGAALPIIVMTAYANVPTSVRALKTGAFDFLRKPTHPKKLLERIHAAIAAHQRALALEDRHAGVRERLARLTPRERQVTQLLLEGKTSKQIAVALGLSVRTVEGYRHMIFTKMRVPSVARLIFDIVTSAPPAKLDRAGDGDRTPARPRRGPA
jgi:two-component system response regulator FixJ